MSTAVETCKRELIYDVEQPVDAVLADLKELADWTQQATAKRKTYLRWLTVAILTTIVGLFLTFVAPPLALLCVVGLGASVALAVMRQGWPDMSRTSRRHELLASVLNAVGRDMAKDTITSVRLVLSPPNEAAKKTNNGQAAGWKVTYYNDPWLTVRGRLVDGTAFQVHLVEKFQDRKKWKRSASGKYKLKRKSKSTTEAMVLLRPKRAIASRLPECGPDQQAKLLLPPWIAVKRFTLAKGTLTLVVRVADEWSLQPAPHSHVRNGREIVVRMLLGLYRIVGETRLTPQT